MLKGTSLDTYNIKSETVNNAIIQLGDIDDTGKGKHFTSRFIQAGLVKIEGHGIVLLKKETLDMSLQSMVGAPVIIKHQDVTDENADELRCGVISKAYFNELDGWYYAEGIIWDTKAQELINNKDWSVSCSYDFLSYNDEGGVENNIKYDKEFTSLNFTHLALVNNPRYERANIVFNSKLIDNSKEKEMSLIDEIKKLIRKVENNKETEEMIENEKTDKRKLIDEVAGIMKSAGCDDEDIRTAIGKMEKIGYDASEDSKADNKKVKNEDEEDKEKDKKEDKEVDNEDAEDKKEAEDLKEDAKEDVKNKCKNSKSSFDKINEIYNSVKTLKEKTEYETRDVKLKNAEEYFG